MKMQSVLCLMMVLRGGFANPVASEGSAGSGVGVLASIGEAFFPLMSSMVSDEINESKIKVGDENELEHGQWYNMETVTKLGAAYFVQNDKMCCEKCKKLYGATEFFGLTSYHLISSFKGTIRDCVCMNSKPGVEASTHAKGRVTGQCGIQAYNGKGSLGDGQTFLRGSTDYLGVITNVDDASSCCFSCMAMGKFPATQLYEFAKEDKQCHCHKPKIDDVPETRPLDYSIGTCPAIEVTEAAIEADVSEAEDGLSAADSGVSEAVISEVAVSEEIVSLVENSESNASPAIQEGGDNTHEAAALTIPASQAEVCDGGFNCCPHPTDGDNTLGTEQFIQESQYKKDFSSCSDACKKLYPFSNGVTQSKTQTYKSNKLPFCWCEFGQYKLHASTGYQTCLFKAEEVVEDDYDY